MNKVVLITGCSSGFGLLTAKLLAERGYRVCAGVRNPKDLVKAEKENNLRTILLDIEWSQNKISEVVNEIIQKEGQIDVVVNNAGFGFLGVAGDFTEEELKEQFETNFFGQFRIIKAVLPHVRQRHSGLIINVNTISGLVTTAFYGVYSASKFALEAITTSLRFEESINGVNFVSLHPGSFRTKFWENVRWAVGSSVTNNKVSAIVEKTKWHRGNPIKVARKILQIIEAKNPKKRYLVGFDAYFIYYFFRIVPYTLIDAIGKTVIKRI